MTDALAKALRSGANGRRAALECSIELDNKAANKIDAMRALLEEVYLLHGPGGDGIDTKYPPREYAAFSAGHIAECWDFPDRHLMHRIAKVITS